MASIGDKSNFPLYSTGLMPQEEMLEVKKTGKKLTIGMPKEKSKFENRLALTPQGIELLVENGHTVLFESGAGQAANLSDQDFAECGACIVKNNSEIFKAEIVLKISPFTDEELDLLSPGQTIISLVQLHQQSRELIKKMLSKKVNAIAFELIKDNNGYYPVTRSMSEIEGAASIMIASEYLSKAHNGKGVLLGGITGVSPAEVVILGAGTAGESAARAALGLGATVKVFDNSFKNLRELQLHIGQRIFTSVLYPKALTKALKSADAVIGNLRYLQSGLSYMVTEDQVSKMKQGSVLIDLSMGQGGCFESSICTDFAHPVFIKHGVIHYCVPTWPLMWLEQQPSH
ncbi:alanine dehydrogenase 2 [Saccharicrinis fermentans DSM 9555 = JCM 21142]|uniref:Alanine dehydrogenase 2 n=1 Tax=Saccharicrinis fermentans DSM 9555 = JCM 21142 TaxID=869213 RepID=W7Y2D2_9BACT|nr:NAD(P)-dependent oxidoreductase [Saccharicrinis fermentans]GAF01693.1 alanine dehydrogenase 2 [Saccharicrinis fermentans DSM 9555 = JCM 21142]